jgi:hypothetical protein
MVFYEIDALAESEFCSVAADLRDLGNLLAARCKWGHRGLGALVSMSNPRTQTNPAVHLLFVKAITDKLWKDHERYILFYLSKYESITLILLIQEEELFYSGSDI